MKAFYHKVGLTAKENSTQVFVLVKLSHLFHSQQRNDKTSLFTGFGLVYSWHGLQDGDDWYVCLVWWRCLTSLSSCRSARGDDPRLGGCGQPAGPQRTILPSSRASYLGSSPHEHNKRLSSCLHTRDSVKSVFFRNGSYFDCSSGRSVLLCQ